MVAVLVVCELPQPGVVRITSPDLESVRGKARTSYLHSTIGLALRFSSQAGAFGSPPLDATTMYRSPSLAYTSELTRVCPLFRPSCEASDTAHRARVTDEPVGVFIHERMDPQDRSQNACGANTTAETTPPVTQFAEEAPCLHYLIYARSEITDEAT